MLSAICHTKINYKLFCSTKVKNSNHWNSAYQHVWQICYRIRYDMNTGLISCANIASNPQTVLLNYENKTNVKYHWVSDFCIPGGSFSLTYLDIERNIVRFWKSYHVPYLSWLFTAAGTHYFAQARRLSQHVYHCPNSYFCQHLKKVFLSHHLSKYLFRFNSYLFSLFCYEYF